MEGNSGETGGSLWWGCSKRGSTKPSSLVRESGIAELSRQKSIRHNRRTFSSAQIYFKYPIIPEITVFLCGNIN
jgi:hypothetical protein